MDLNIRAISSSFHLEHLSDIWNQQVQEQEMLKSELILSTFSLMTSFQSQFLISIKGYTLHPGS